MKGRYRILLLGTAVILTVMGFLTLSKTEDAVITFLCFLSAVLFLYAYFGKIKLFCSLSEIHSSSSELVMGDGHRKKSKWTPLQIGSLTFSVILLCFSIGFGIGRTLYQIIN